MKAAESAFAPPGGARRCQTARRPGGGCTSSRRRLRKSDGAPASARRCELKAKHIYASLARSRRKRTRRGQRSARASSSLNIKNSGPPCRTSRRANGWCRRGSKRSMRPVGGRTCRRRLARRRRIGGRQLDLENAVRSPHARKRNAAARVSHRERLAHRRRVVAGRKRRRDHRLRRAPTTLFTPRAFRCSRDSGTGLLLGSAAADIETAAPRSVTREQKAAPK